jgi:hypothetical protein
MNAAIYFQRGICERKQEQACLEYIDEQRWAMTHVVPYWSADAAVALVLVGCVGVIVAAYYRKELEVIAADIAGRGQVVYVHPTPTVVRPPRRILSVVDLVLKWHGHGRTPREIAVDLDTDSTDIRAILRRHGQYPA